MMRTVVVAAAALITLAAAVPPLAPAARAQGAQPPPPRLIVLLVVDQLRADYPDLYGAGWTAGFKRLIQEGAWYTNAAYPYLHTVTCAGHATIGTGRFPRSHGIIMNSWFSREIGKGVDCVGDPQVSTLTSEGTAAGGESGALLREETLAERIKKAGGRVVTMSLKGRSAIMPAGHKSDATVWFGGRGSFITSTAFSESLPAFVREMNASAPVSAERASPPWVKLLPAEAYRGDDDTTGERAPAGWTNSFPHPFDLPQFFPLWQASPLSDAYLGRLAAAAIDSYKLGQGPSVDFLSVSFSALDVIGHAFGPESHETQDLLARLDVTIGGLLAKLDERVGRGSYVLALTADHGVAPIPERVKARGEDAGRIDLRALADKIDAALQTPLGPGQYVATVVYTDIYFGPGVWRRIARDREALDAVKRAVLSSPGVERVFDANELEKPRGNDSLLHAASLSWFKGRSGDMLLIPKRYWIASGAATTHGTLHDYDQRVPVIFMGPAALVSAGKYEAPATPADIAPTLARLAGIPFETPDGRALALRP